MEWEEFEELMENLKIREKKVKDKLRYQKHIEYH